METIKAAFIIIAWIVGSYAICHSKEKGHMYSIKRTLKYLGFQLLFIIVIAILGVFLNVLFD